MRSLFSGGTESEEQYRKHIVRALLTLIGTLILNTYFLDINVVVLMLRAVQLVCTKKTNLFGLGFEMHYRENME